MIVALAQRRHVPVRQMCGRPPLQGVWGCATPPAGSARGGAASQIVNHAFVSGEREGQRPLADYEPHVRKWGAREAEPARKL